MRFPTMWYMRPAKDTDQPAHMRSLIRVFLVAECSMIVKLLTEHQFEFLSLKLHTLELSLKQINKILGQIDGYLFFWPFCSEKKICEKPRRSYRLWKNADVC